MTTRGRWILIAGLFVLTAAITFYELFVHQSDTTLQYPVTRTIKYSFTVKNPNGFPVKNSELWVYSPIRESAFQHLVTLVADHPYSEMDDPLGNKRIGFVINDLSPYASKTISVTATVKLSDHGDGVDRLRSETDLSDDKFIALNDPAIKKVAANLKAEAPRDTVEKIYSWITRNIKRAGYRKENLGARYALKSKSGDCTEFMYLFSALARANGIPTRNMGGFVARENKILRAADYHNWNEVYIDGEWYLIDTDKQVFMRNSSEYIAMRLIGDSGLHQSVDSQSFFSSSDAIRVSMN